jgi:NAD(P)-dependent dehydrogenase (short-subunit alcohol dehydrogenase family)
LTTHAPTREGRLAKQVALVTGGAGNLGAAICARLAEEGAKVAIADVDVASAESDAAELAKRGLDAFGLALDVASESSWAEAITTLQRRYGGISLLVNNAGILSMAPIEAVTSEEITRVFDVNVRGTFLGVREAVKSMRSGGRGGSIVNVSSLGAMAGEPNLSVYNASKAAVRYLTKCVALECAARQDNIRINSIHPGLIIGERPPMHVKHLLAKGVRPPEPPGGMEAVVRQIPMQRPGEPRDVANLVLFLASAEAAYITGGEYTVDGGWSAK